MSHRPPFQSLTHLPADLAMGFWVITAGIASDFWWHDARPWIAQRLTMWGQRLA